MKLNKKQLRSLILEELSEFEQAMKDSGIDRAGLKMIADGGNEAEFLPKVHIQTLAGYVLDMYDAIAKMDSETRSAGGMEDRVKELEEDVAMLKEMMTSQG